VGSSDDKEVVHSSEIEGDLQKSATRDTKRKKLEHGLEVEVDMSIDTDVNSSVNDTKSECANMWSNQPASDTVLEKCTTGEDTCADVSGESDIKTIAVRNGNLNGDSSHDEEGSVAENNTEYTGSLRETEELA
jgi:hypothetical protein